MSSQVAECYQLQQTPCRPNRLVCSDDILVCILYAHCRTRIACNSSVSHTTPLQELSCEVASSSQHSSEIEPFCPLSAADAYAALLGILQTHQAMVELGFQCPSTHPRLRTPNSACCSALMVSNLQPIFSQVAA